MRSKKIKSKRGGAHRSLRNKELLMKKKEAQKRIVQKLMAEQVPMEEDFLKSHRGLEDENGRMFNHNLYDEYWNKEFDILPASAHPKIQRLAAARMDYAKQLPDSNPAKQMLIDESNTENIKRRWTAKRADEALLNSYNVINSNNAAAAAAAPANNERSIMNRVTDVFSRFGLGKKSKKGKSNNKSKRGKKSKKGKKSKRSRK